MLICMYQAYPLLASDNILKKKYYKYSEDIQVTDSGFFSNVEVTGTTANCGIKLTFPISSLTEIIDYQAAERKKSKWRRIKDLRYTKQSKNSDMEFYDESMFLAGFNLPEEMIFNLKFKSFCRELMLLDFLSFNALLADTSDYVIHIPPDHAFFFHLDYARYLTHLSIDSTVGSDGSRTYSFRIVSSKVELVMSRQSDQSTAFVRQHYPGVRMIVIPTVSHNDPTDYLNEWYVKHLQALTDPNEISKQMIDSIGQSSNPDSIIKKLFEFARDRIRYINVYRGMETILPKNVNQIINLRMGDCKDKANFLCQALNQKGFDARLAICSTRDHAFDMDFPSLIGGNHMVCLVRMPGSENWQVLDPTNSNATPARPGNMIENRTLFVFGSKGSHPFFYRIPQTNANNTTIRIDLQLNKESCSGEMSIMVRGYAGDRLRSLFRRLGTGNYTPVISEFLRNLSKVPEYSMISFRVWADSVLIRCHISLDGSGIYVLDSKTYIPLNFLPLMHKDFPQTGSGDLLIDYQVNDWFDLSIETGTSIKGAKLRETDIGGDPQFRLWHNSSNRKFALHYNLRIRNTDIASESQKHFYDCFTSISKYLNDVIVVETTD